MIRPRLIRTVLTLLATTLLVLGSSLALTNQPSSATGAACPVPSRLEMEPIPAGATPVVLVHGWTGRGEDLHPLGDALQREYGGDIAVRYFDYWSDSVRWAAEPQIAACLADYLHRASAQAGVPAVVVAHSMGGLATRFAGSPDHAARPITSDQVSEVVTIATPHRGSPWGGQMVSTGQELWVILLSYGAMPPAGLADLCLALHDAGAGLDDPCDPPPYLPAGINLVQIEGENFLHRDLMGIRLYSIDQRGDGIVLEDSAGLYAGSAGQPTPTGYRLANETVSCDARASERKSHLVRFLQEGEDHFVVAWVRTLTDGATMDSILAGKLDLLSGPQWLATALLSDCGHTRITDHPETVQHAIAAVDRAVTANAVPTGPRLYEVPASCEQPSQNLAIGHTEKDGKGYNLAGPVDWPAHGVEVVGYFCSRGGPTWPGILLFYQGGVLQGELPLKELEPLVYRGEFQMEQARVEGERVVVPYTWQDTGGVPYRRGEVAITWDGGPVIDLIAGPDRGPFDWYSGDYDVPWMEGTQRFENGCWVGLDGSACALRIVAASPMPNDPGRAAVLMYAYEGDLPLLMELGLWTSTDGVRTTTGPTSDMVYPGITCNVDLSWIEPKRLAVDARDCEELGRLGSYAVMGTELLRE